MRRCFGFSRLPRPCRGVRAGLHRRAVPGPPHRCLLRAGVARETGMPACLTRAAVAFLAALVDDICSPA